MSLLIFGCGYLGQRVAARWAASGGEVYPVTRSPQRAEQFRRQGWQPILADPAQKQSLDQLPRVKYVLYSVGFDRSSQQTIEQVFAEGLANVLASIDPAIRRLAYISSTGVYGQAANQWVDEHSECSPRSDGGKACLMAERLLHEHPLGPRSNVLRVAGLYGPQRVPRLKDLVAGAPLATARRGYLNLVHVDDAASIVVSVLKHAPPGKTYVVSDGHPVRRQEYFEELARLASAPPPTFVDPDPNAPVTSRAGSSKRVNNQRLLKDVPVTLSYPTYREGLAAILADR